MCHRDELAGEHQVSGHAGQVEAEGRAAIRTALLLTTISTTDAVPFVLVSFMSSPLFTDFPELSHLSSVPVRPPFHSRRRSAAPAVGKTSRICSPIRSTFRPSSTRYSA